MHRKHEGKRLLLGIRQNRQNTVSGRLKPRDNLNLTPLLGYEVYGSCTPYDIIDFWCALLVPFPCVSMAICKY